MNEWMRARLYLTSNYTLSIGSCLMRLSWPLPHNRVSYHIGRSSICVSTAECRILPWVRVDPLAASPSVDYSPGHPGIRREFTVQYVLFTVVHKYRVGTLAPRVVPDPGYRIYFYIIEGGSVHVTLRTRENRKYLKAVWFLRDIKVQYCTVR